MKAGADWGPDQMHTVRGRRFKRLPIGLVNQTRMSAFRLYGMPGDRSSLRTAFLLGHMRSGSSLLTKLLSTTPEVLEFGELHLNYRSKSDFTAMTGRLLWKRRQVRVGDHQRIALDKLLHNYQLPIERCELLVTHQALPMILLREPAPTISSIVRTFRNFSKDRAVDYYIERVNMLTEYARTLGPEIDVLGIEYGDIVDRTDALFDSLTKHLGLEEKLRHQYSHTGPYGRADPSKNLATGRILTSAERSPSPDNVFEVGREAELAHQECRYAMRTHCIAVG